MSAQCDQVKRSLPFLSRAAAARYARTALAHRFKSSYRHGYAKRTSGSRRISRTKVWFRTVSWVIGDISYRGRATIWYAWSGRRISWNYAYRIKRTNEYCKATRRLRCTKTYVVT